MSSLLACCAMNITISINNLCNGTICVYHIELPRISMRPKLLLSLTTYNANVKTKQSVNIMLLKFVLVYCIVA